MLVCCLAGSGVVVEGATTERFHRFQPLLTFFTDTQAQAGQKVGLSWILSLSLSLLFSEKSLFQNRSIKSTVTSLVLWPMEVVLQKVSDEVKQKNVPASALN